MVCNPIQVGDKLLYVEKGDGSVVRIFGNFKRVVFQGELLVLDNEVLK